MNHIFIGFFVATVYGAIAAGVVWYIEGFDTYSEFQNAYFVSFNCAISGGLIISAAILVFKTQASVPNLIEEVFGDNLLADTEYGMNRAKFFSLSRSISFSTTFVVVSFCIFYLAEFPFEGLPEYFLIAAACTQYALAVYVGRKLFYIAQMLYSIERIDIKEDIFTDDRLSLINTYVNSISTFTLIFVFSHVYSFYHGPFVYSSFLGETVRILLLLLAVMATPVLVLFNFYPRTVIKSLYMKSIKHRVDAITENLANKKRRIRDGEAIVPHRVRQSLKR